jgi:hypothetical protein
VAEKFMICSLDGRQDRETRSAQSANISGP